MEWIWKVEPGGTDYHANFTIWLEWIWNFEPVYTGYHANSHEIISLEKWNGQNGQNGIHSVLVYKKRCKIPTSAVSYFFLKFN